MGFFRRLFGLDSRPILPPQAPVEYQFNESVTYSSEPVDSGRPIRPIGEPVKRGRGRPRKTEAGGVLVKRGRGRPRKTEAGGTQLVAPVARAAAKKPKKKGGKKGKGKSAY